MEDLISLIDRRLNVISVDSMDAERQPTGWEGEREARGRGGALSSSCCQGGESVIKNARYQSQTRR